MLFTYVFKKILLHNIETYFDHLKKNLITLSQKKVNRNLK